MAELGRSALIVALGLELWAVGAGAYAAWRGRRRLAASARNAIVGAFAATALATVVLLVAHLRRDFSFRYVAEHTSLALPDGYAAASLWSGQEGSLLLWLLILTTLSAVVVLFTRRAARVLLPWVVPVLGVVGAFFAFLLVAVASPFATQAAPADGMGLNPSLQNPYMLAHPPLLYLGYVGLTIPFAFAIGALLARRGDELWIVATRRWTLFAWMFLGVGQLLGAHWAYVEIGWGGYYAWDPVENAALMPWLAATAFLHSVMIQEKRGMLKIWNVALVHRRVLPLALRHLPDALGRSSTRSTPSPRARSAPGSSASSRFVTAASVADRPEPHRPAALAHAARVGRLARGDVPLQQPAARRALPDHPLGRRLPARLRGGARRDGDRRAALLQLLPRASSGCRCCC